MFLFFTNSPAFFPLNISTYFDILGSVLTKSRLREKVKPFSKRYKGIAHIHRLSIIYLLAYGSKDVFEIVDATGLAENLISHHLKQLYLTGWVLRTKSGRRVTYRLNEKAFFELNRMLSDTPFDRQVLSRYSKK